MHEKVTHQVTCVGVVTLDALALVDQYPACDERVVAQTIRFAGGGPAATAAVVLARQGVKVSFVGRVGDDEAGREALNQLESEGVNVSGVERSRTVATQTSCVIVAEQAQTRAISTLQVPPLNGLTLAAQERIAASTWVHADHLGFAPLADFLRGLHRRPLVSLDAGNPVAGLDLTMVDLFVPTVESLGSTAGIGDDPTAAAKAVMNHGTAAVVATDGARGSFAWWGDRSTIAAAAETGTAFAPAATGVDIVSTLGAGDVFHGGLLAALCRGESWSEALRSANWTAALSCRALDGRSAVPTLDELRAAIGAA
ncbi:MAG: carbohydrate kinase family protein [Propionibacteriaceae bacterium]|jgi:sugar/nucleoside kinase (ribokinase family)|nr:carbohydrate kinase family protein [Propionibacteriaceae bacterium]